MNPHTDELFSLKGKVAIITGGAGWLGAAMTEALAQAGAAVVVAEVDAPATEALAASLTRQGLDVRTIVADVTQEEPLRDCIDSAARDAGRLDILVNGFHTAPYTQLDRGSIDDYTRDLRTGPAAYTVAAEHSAVHMRRTGGGSIINIASMYGMVPGYPRLYEGLCEPNALGYQAGKAAILHLTRYLAVYWAKDNIRVNAISPGPFHNTQAHAGSLDPQFLPRLQREVPLARIGRPAEIKGAVLFLAADASSYVTGHNLVVDGGWTVW